MSARIPTLVEHLSRNDVIDVNGQQETIVKIHKGDRRYEIHTRRGLIIFAWARAAYDRLLPDTETQ